MVGIENLILNMLPTLSNSQGLKYITGLFTDDLNEVRQSVRREVVEGKTANELSHKVLDNLYYYKLV